MGARGSVACGIGRGDVRLYTSAAPDKKRPSVVLTRNCSIGSLATVTVAQITSTIRGVASEVLFGEDDGMKASCAVNLHNAMTVRQNQLGKCVARLSPARMSEVCRELTFSPGCEQEYGERRARSGPSGSYTQFKAASHWPRSTPPEHIAASFRASSHNRFDEEASALALAALANSVTAGKGAAGSLGYAII